MNRDVIQLQWILQDFSYSSRIFFFFFTLFNIVNEDTVLCLRSDLGWAATSLESSHSTKSFPFIVNLSNCALMDIWTFLVLFLRSCYLFMLHANQQLLIVGLLRSQESFLSRRLMLRWIAHWHWVFFLIELALTHTSILISLIGTPGGVWWRQKPCVWFVYSIKDKRSRLSFISLEMIFYLRKKNTFNKCNVIFFIPYITHLLSLDRNSCAWGCNPLLYRGPQQLYLGLSNSDKPLSKGLEETVIFLLYLEPQTFDWLVITIDLVHEFVKVQRMK